jgi:hypothetical protein
MKSVFNAIKWLIEHQDEVTALLGLVGVGYAVLMRSWVARLLPKQVRKALGAGLALSIVEQLAKQGLDTEEKRKKAAVELKGALERAGIRLEDRQINLLIELAYNRLRNEKHVVPAP